MGIYMACFGSSSSDLTSKPPADAIPGLLDPLHPSIRSITSITGFRLPHFNLADPEQPDTEPWRSTFNLSTIPKPLNHLMLSFPGFLTVRVTRVHLHC